MEYYNNRLCLTYSELTSGDPDAESIKDKPIITVATYRNLCNRSQIKVLRRGCRGKEALIEYESLDSKYKAAVRLKIGDVYEIVHYYSLSNKVVHDFKAADFFSNPEKTGQSLKTEKQIEYTNNASVLNCLDQMLNDAIKERRSQGRASLPGIWENFSKSVNATRTKLGHNLPKNEAALKRKYNDYKKNGYAALISGKFGNSNTAKVKDDEQEALLMELLGNWRNLDDEFIKESYNTIAQKMGWKEISRATVLNKRKQYNLVITPGRRGSSHFNNSIAMQVKRKAPTKAMIYWTVDGWDVELMYQEKPLKGATTYHHRPTVVILLDPCCKYPIGYAIGDRESPELIRKAFREAFRHTQELFGEMYKPWQLQTDNYGKGTLTPFYEACSEIYTPAKAHNSKAKVIEPYFKTLNDKYCRMENNWSGYGVTSRKESQPNAEWLNKVKKNFPDKAGCYAQVESIIKKIRAEKLTEYKAMWNNTSLDERSKLDKTTYLQWHGETTGYTNKLTGQGLGVRIDKELLWFDTFNTCFRELAFKNWIVKFDPEDLEEVLVVDNAGTKTNLVEGTTRFMLQRKYVQPMALLERQENDFEELKKIRDFNKDLEQKVIEKRTESRELVQELFSRPELQQDTLQKLLITDSRGQHKNQRNELAGRGTPEIAEVIEDDFVPVFDVNEFLKQI